jgi:hypothetical protein
VGAGQRVGRGADVHFGVVQHEVLEPHELAVERQAGQGVGEMGPRDPAFADGARPETLVEPGEAILGGGEWCRI